MWSTIKMRFYIVSTIFIDLTHIFFIIYDKNAVNYDKNAYFSNLFVNKGF